MADKEQDFPGEQEFLGTILPPRGRYPTLELGLTLAVVMVGRRWRAMVDEKLRQIGHSASRMEAMAAIAYAPPGTTQIQIAKRIGIEGPTLTRTLDMLEKEGLVERLADPEDRRNKHMRLTPDGFVALADMMSRCDDMRTLLLENIPAEEIKANRDFLVMLQNRIEAGLGEEEAD